MADTQHIRNAYLARPVEDIDVPFGRFAANYIGVEDKWLQSLHNIGEACNYILNMGYTIPTPEYSNVRKAQPQGNSPRQTREGVSCSAQ